MKNQLKYRFVLLALVSVCFVLIGFQNIYGQDNNKNRVRLNADYFKVIDGEKYLDLKATARVDKYVWQG